MSNSKNNPVRVVIHHEDKTCSRHSFSIRTNVDQVKRAVYREQKDTKHAISDYVLAVSVDDLLEISFCPFYRSHPAIENAFQAQAEAHVFFILKSILFSRNASALFEQAFESQPATFLNPEAPLKVSVPTPIPETAKKQKIQVKKKEEGSLPKKDSSPSDSPSGEKTTSLNSNASCATCQDFQEIQEELDHLRDLRMDIGALYGLISADIQRCKDETTELTCDLLNPSVVLERVASFLEVALGGRPNELKDIPQAVGLFAPTEIIKARLAHKRSKLKRQMAFGDEHFRVKPEESESQKKKDAAKNPSSLEEDRSDRGHMLQGLGKGTMQLDLPSSARKSSGPKKKRIDHTDIWRLPFEKVKPCLKEFLGQGSFGKVYRGSWEGEDVAFKLINYDESKKEKLVKDFEKEVNVLSQLKHPNLLRFLGACCDPPNLCIITEFATNGEVKALLASDKKLSWQMRLQIAEDVAKAMLYLHTRKPKIIHRDLKSENVLLCKDWRACLIDFGLAKYKMTAQTFRREESTVAMTQLMAQGKSKGPSPSNPADAAHPLRNSQSYVEFNYFTSLCGSPAWMAPEIMQMKPYDERVDVYAFAVFLWELLTRQPPHLGKGIDMIALDLDNRERLEIPDYCPHLYRTLIEACWAHKASKRPSFHHILPAIRICAQEPVTLPN